MTLKGAISYEKILRLAGSSFALRSFKSDIESNIDKADTNWRHLTGLWPKPGS